MKKKIIIWTSVLLGVGIISVYTIADSIILDEHTILADHLVFENLDEATTLSDLVVVAMPTGDSENILENNDGFIDGYTLTNINIEQILENNTNETFSEKQMITVAEPMFIVDKPFLSPGKNKFTYEEYTELKPGSKYVLFLKYQERTDVYWVNALEQGKYNIDHSDQKEMQITSNISNREKIKQEILEKYDIR